MQLQMERQAQQVKLLQQKVQNCSTSSRPRQPSSNTQPTLAATYFVF